MRISFHKMHGAGNDFVVLDARHAPMPAPRPALVRHLCDRHLGVGCDQLVLLDAPADADEDVRARFFNPDGGEAGACGNATRCVAWLVAGGTAERPVRVRTRAGMLPARVLDDGRVEVDMGRPALGWAEVPLARPVDTLRLPLPGEPAACSMGNPHATFFGDERDPLVAGPALEHDPLFPERANIGFAEALAFDRLRLRVWERGAGLTRACGSGACAAAVNAARRGLCGRRVSVEMPGGTLEIVWGADDRVRMTGPAVLSFTGSMEIGEAER